MEEALPRAIKRDHEGGPFGASCLYDVGHEERVSVAYDPEDGRAYSIEGQRLEIGGLAVVGPGETEAQARP